MTERRVTVQLLADQLGLSKFSVSRALAGKPGVGEATRARVLRAAQSSGYRGLATAAAPVRQVLFVRHEQDSIPSELWINMLHGAEREGTRHGLSIIPRQAQHLGDLARLDAAVVGLVLALSRPTALSRDAARTGLPVVCAGHVDALEPVDQVVGADYEGGVAVARFLTGLGHRGIGFVRGNPGLYGRSERFRGLLDGARATPGVEVRELGFTEPDGFRAAFLAMLRSGAAPTALFCAQDGLAVTAVSELLRLGVSVPDDISVVGYNDFLCATQIVPPLTTIRLPQEQMGVAMVRCIVERLSQPVAERLPPIRLVVVPELVERRSTARPGMRDWVRRLVAGEAEPVA